jgi:iron(III) transport system permease protein
VIDSLASLPIVFPGLVLGLAIMICYLHVGSGIYGTLWIMLIAYATRFMPYGMRYSTTSMLALHKELEESAAMSGASWRMTFQRIVLPLLKPGLIAGWIYIVIVSVRELSGSILLYSPGSEVVSIMIWEYWQNGQYVELSALGVMLIVPLFCFVLVAQFVSRRFGMFEWADSHHTWLASRISMASTHSSLRQRLALCSASAQLPTHSAWLQAAMPWGQSLLGGCAAKWITTQCE